MLKVLVQLECLEFLQLQLYVDDLFAWAELHLYFESYTECNNKIVLI